MKVAIIGAGLSGLAAGHKLRRLGHDVTLYEASDRAGGRGMLLNRPGTDDWADVGSQYFHSNYTHGLKLIDELGLTPKLKKIVGKSRVFTGDGDKSYLLNPNLPWMKDGGLRGNVSVGAYVARLLLGKKWDTFGASAQQSKYDEVSALSSTSNKFVTDKIVRMLSLVGGLNEPADANVNLLQIYRLIKIILTTDYISLEGGTATLHQTLASQSDIRFNSKVSALTETDGRGTGFELTNGERIEADHVIVAAHAPSAAELTPDTWVEEKAFLSSIEMPPTYIVSFFLNRVMEKDVWSYFLPMDHTGPVTFCVDAQQKSPGNHPSGKANFQAWILSPKSKALSGLSDQELGDLALSDVAQFFPELRQSVEGFHVTRHHAAVPQSSVGHNARALEFMEVMKTRKGISYCGDYFSGGYMESALWSVAQMIERLAQSEPKAQEVAA